MKVSFKQIAPLSDQLVCLDTGGNVWLYDKNGWAMIEPPTMEVSVTVREGKDDHELGNRSSVLDGYIKSQKGR